MKWTDSELYLMRELYPDLPSSDVAALLDRPIGTVHQCAARYQLSKSEYFKAQDASGRIQRARQDPRMVANQFKPGRTTWNKGLFGSTGNHPNCRTTHFKPGRLPQDARNYLPIGSLRISGGKVTYLQRKMTDDPNLKPTMRWMPVHRLVWEAAHGPIPLGMIVVFKPGCKTLVLEEITADKLDCITRKEHAIRNHPISHSPEYAQLCQLKGAITRQVNRIKQTQA